MIQLFRTDLLQLPTVRAEALGMQYHFKNAETSIYRSDTEDADVCRTIRIKCITVIQNWCMRRRADL